MYGITATNIQLRIPRWCIFPVDSINVIKEDSRSFQTQILETVSKNGVDQKVKGEKCCHTARTENWRKLAREQRHDQKLRHIGHFERQFGENSDGGCGSCGGAVTHKCRGRHKDALAIKVC